MNKEKGKSPLLINGHKIESLDELKDLINSGRFNTSAELVTALRDGTVHERFSTSSEDIKALLSSLDSVKITECHEKRNDTEKGVLCINGRYIETLDELKRIIRDYQYDIGTIQTNELLAAFRDGAVQEWLSTGTEEEIALAKDFSRHSMRHDRINDTELLSLIVKLFGNLNIKSSKHNLNVSLQFLSATFVSPTGKRQDIKDKAIVCTESGKVKFLVCLKSDRAVNGSANVFLNCSEQALALPQAMPLNTADKDSVLVEYEFDYNPRLEYPIEFLYNDIVLYKCFLTSVITENGHEAIDLGLSVKWANMNIGSNLQFEPGSFFSFGEDKAKQTYREDNYHGNNVDAAHKIWGGRWRMPTKEEFQELIDNCTWTWKTTAQGQGYEFKSKINDKSIFLCAAGMKDGDKLIGKNDCGQYWVNPHDGNGKESERLLFSKMVGSRISSKKEKYHGLSIRPVLP